MTINKNTASLLRRYIFEVSIIGLAGAVCVLFWKVDRLNYFIQENLINQNIENRKAIEQNTNALTNFIQYNQNKVR
jgi:hypothetical protein